MQEAAADGGENWAVSEKESGIGAVARSWRRIIDILESASQERREIATGGEFGKRKDLERAGKRKREKPLGENEEEKERRGMERLSRNAFCAERHSLARLLRNSKYKRGMQECAQYIMSYSRKG